MASFLSQLWLSASLCIFHFDFNCKVQSLETKNDDKKDNMKLLFQMIVQFLIHQQFQQDVTFQVIFQAS